jgi:hypothetical protein
MHHPLKSSRELCPPYLLPSQPSAKVPLILEICPRLRASRLILMPAHLGRLWTISWGLRSGMTLTLTAWSNDITSNIIRSQHSGKLLKHMDNRCFARSIRISGKRKSIVSSNAGCSNHLTLLFHVSLSISSSQQVQKS